MASAMNAGKAVGRGIGKTAAVLWKGACLTASASGTFGEGVIAGTEQGFEERCAKWDANHAKKLALREVAMAKYAAEQAAKTVAIQVA